MIQLICIAFLCIWAFWTWAASNGLSLTENIIFALLPALATAGVVMFLGVIFAGVFGVFAK